MIDSIYYILLGIILIIVELCYFKLANRFNIIDQPNNRSSHSLPTIRGGGILFPLAALIWFTFHNFQLALLILALMLLSVISFLDDYRPLQASLRFVIHSISIAILFYQISFFDWDWWLVILAFIVSVGTLSAFNFMDGINGITGIYAIVSLATFFYINRFIVFIVNDAFIITFLVAVLIFLFFNFRKKAICFAGDVGSVTLAFVQIFLLLQLISATDNFFWVIMFLVFGVDSVITIINRLVKKENIFKPHRTHLYQYLSNEMGYSHQMISLLYGLFQLVLNSILIWSFVNNKVEWSLLASLIYVLLYMTLRFFTMKSIGKKVSSISAS